MRTGKASRRIAPILAAALLLALPMRTSEAQSAGVRHRIDASVTLEPKSPLLTGFPGARGAVSFLVRLSANSRETRYFGMLSPSFSDIVVSDKAPLVAQTKIWEESVCHQRRGLPKVTVTSVKGAFVRDQEKFDVSAVVRHIGLHVPSDELTPGIKLPAGADEIGSFYALRAQTRDSRLNIDLKIYAFDCPLVN
jgi:hypothetical protein